MRSVGASLAFIAALMTSGCGRRPPPMPYATVGVYDGRCGYDYNGAAIDIGDLNKAAKRWDRGTEAVLLFRFEPEPVPQDCFEKARAALQAAGFAHVWVIVTPRPGPKDPPVMP